MKNRIEIFTAGCPLCEPVVKLVKETATSDQEVVTYNLSTQCDTKECLEKVQSYGIKRVPSIALDGHLLDCCQQQEITKADLLRAGIGKA